MNKYKEFQKPGNHNALLHSFERGELEAARMRKPGYRRKMRRTNNKHAKNASR